MKNLTHKRVWLFGLLVLFGAACTWAPIETQEPSAKPVPDKAVPADVQEGWPREAKSGAVNFKVYQPQLESWVRRDRLPAVRSEGVSEV